MGKTLEEYNKDIEKYNSLSDRITNRILQIKERYNITDEDYKELESFILLLDAHQTLYTIET